VIVPLALRTDLGISLLANTVSLTPGTVSAWLSPDRSHLVVHGLKVSDPTP
jgi:multicomponent K+:H+ antiporter subunit E